MNLRWLQKGDGRWVEQTYQQIGSTDDGLAIFDWVDKSICASCAGTGVSPNQPEGCTDCNGNGQDRMMCGPIMQTDKRQALLRDVIRSGGKDNWSHLHSHGHHFPTIRSAVNSGYLSEPRRYHYEITDAGRSYIDSWRSSKKTAP